MKVNKLLFEEKVTQTTYDKIADVWSSQHMTKGFWEKEMKKFHKLLPAGKVLEIGSGGGRDARELTAVGYEYIGTDVSKGLLNEARKNFPNLKFYKQSVYELSFPERFDGFWCAAVLLHVPKARIGEALARIKSVMKPGAVGFISIKDGEGERLELESWDNGRSKHQRLFAYWPKDKFAEELNRRGFIIVDYAYRPDSERTRWHCFFVRTIKN